MREDEISEEEIEDTLFWAGLHGIRDVEIKAVREWLERDGFIVDADPPDDRLAIALATLIDRLFSIGVVIRSTDHLSDRELYAWLLEHLGGHMALLPDSFLFLDVIGSGSEETTNCTCATTPARMNVRRGRSSFPSTTCRHASRHHTTGTTRCLDVYQHVDW